MKNEIVMIFLFTCVSALWPDSGAFAKDFKRFALGGTVSYFDIAPSTIEDVDVEYDQAALLKGDFSLFFSERYALEISAGSIKTEMEVNHDSKSGLFGELEQSQILLTGRFRFPIDKFDAHAYLGAGAGYYFHEFENTGHEAISEFFAVNVSAEADDSIGFHLNVGGEFHITGNLAFIVDIMCVFNRADFYLTTTGLETETEEVSLNTSVFGLGFKYYF